MGPLIGVNVEGAEVRVTETEHCGGGFTPETGLWVRREGSLGHHEVRDGRLAEEAAHALKTTSPRTGAQTGEDQQMVCVITRVSPQKCQLPANSHRAVDDKDPYKPPACFFDQAE